MSSALANWSPRPQSRSPRAKRFPETPRPKSRDARGLGVFGSNYARNPKWNEIQMCALADRHLFSTRLTFLNAGQPKCCFADSPTRFRLTVSADNCHFGKGKTGSAGSGRFGSQIYSLRLGVTNFLLSRWVLRHFLSLGRPDTFTQGHSGPKDSFLSSGRKI